MPVRVFVVRTDLDHLLIYQNEPTCDPVSGWPMPGQKFRSKDGQRGRCVDRFCAVAVRWLGWDTLPKNVALEVKPVS